MAKRYDVAVFGAGPAGGVVAKTCRRAGLSVAVAEARDLGGTCPLRGCEPKKVMVDAMEAQTRVRGMRDAGLRGRVSVDWEELMEFKHSFVEPIPDLIADFYADLGVDVLHGAARFTGPQSFEVLGEPYEAGHIVIAVGAAPRRLQIPGAEYTATSDDFLDLEKLPMRALFLGGGFISFESALVMARAGTQAAIVHRNDRPLKQFDPDLARQACDNARRMGVEVIMDAPLERIEKAGSLCTVFTGKDSRPTLVGDVVVNATGRVPALEALDMDKAGVSWSGAGVEVDEYMRARGNPAVFAAGDAAASGPELTPVAVLQAEAVARTIISGKNQAVDLAGTPSVCFVSPPLASVGLQERDAARSCPGYAKYAGRADGWGEHARIGVAGAQYKVLTDPENDRILGAHLLMEDAEEVINLFAMAIRNGLSLTQLQNMVWSYPSFGYTIRYMLKQ